MINLIFAPAEEKSVAWVEGFAILVAVLVCSLVASTNDYKKSLKFNELFEEEQAKKEVEIIRSGKKLVIHPEELVVGDLVVLKSGMEIYGDGVIVESNCVEVDESSMTGESEPQRKEMLRRCLIEREKYLAYESNNTVKKDFPVPSMVLLAGTKIVAGDGRYIVINVGPNSAIGGIKLLVSAGDEGKFSVIQRPHSKKNWVHWLTTSESSDYSWLS